MTLTCTRCGHRFDDEQPGTGFIGRNETEENYCPGCWVAVKQAWLDEARAELRGGPYGSSGSQRLNMLRRRGHWRPGILK